MKKLFTFLLCLAGFTTAEAIDETMLYDFESFAVGDTVGMWNIYNSDITTSSATVVADPKDASNKVLHIKSRSWNTLVALHISDISSSELTGDGRFLVFDLYRPSADGSYKQLMIYSGNTRVYIDGSFVYQSPPERWKQNATNSIPLHPRANIFAWGLTRPMPNIISIMCVWSIISILVTIVRIPKIRYVILPNNVEKMSVWP